MVQSGDLACCYAEEIRTWDWIRWKQVSWNQLWRSRPPEMNYLPSYSAGAARRHAECQPCQRTIVHSCRAPTCEHIHNYIYGVPVNTRYCLRHTGSLLSPDEAWSWMASEKISFSRLSSWTLLRAGDSRRRWTPTTTPHSRRNVLGLGLCNNATLEASWRFWWLSCHMWFSVWTPISANNVAAARKHIVSDSENLCRWPCTYVLDANVRTFACFNGSDATKTGKHPINKDTVFFQTGESKNALLSYLYM